MDQFTPGQDNGPDSVPVPQSNGYTNIPDYAAGLARQQQTQATTKAGVATATGSVVGGLTGAIKGIADIGSLVASFFAEGGPVTGMADGGALFKSPNQKQYAAGGPAQHNMNPKDKAMLAAFLTGSLHQHNFGGDPQAIPQAADQAKQLLAGHGIHFDQPQGAPQGLATGGEVTPSANPADDPQQMAVNKAIAQAMGLSSNTSQQQPQQSADTGGTTQNMNMTPDQVQQQIPPMATGGPVNKGFVDGGAIGSLDRDGSLHNHIRNLDTWAGNNMSGAFGNRGFADGGANMALPQGQPPQGGDPSNTPPLAPGQVFQGDGSVKGPGTGSSDSIPAKLSDGEFVFSQPAVSFFGVDKLTKLNEQGKQGFMEAVGQVQQNQQQSPGGEQPQAAPPQQPPTPAQPPMQASKGGTISRAGNGYCGAL